MEETRCNIFKDGNIILNSVPVKLHVSYNQQRKQHSWKGKIFPPREIIFKIFPFGQHDTIYEIELTDGRKGQFVAMPSSTFVNMIGSGSLA